MLAECAYTRFLAYVPNPVNLASRERNKHRTGGEDVHTYVLGANTTSCTNMPLTVILSHTPAFVGGKELLVNRLENAIYTRAPILGEFKNR